MPSFGSIVLLFLSSCLGWVTLSLVFRPGGEHRDSGVKAFMYPLCSLNLFTLFGYISDIAELTGANATLFVFLSRCVRLTHGLAWVLFCHRQFALHGVGGFTVKLTLPAIILTLLNILSFVPFGILGFYTEPVYRVNVLVMSVTAFYAAFTAFLLPARANDILPSAWTGMWIAGVSLIAYPLAVVSDVFGYRYPVFSPNRMVWEQVFPAYFLVVNGCILRLLLSGRRIAASEVSLTSLTKREEDVMRLLAARKSYKEVSLELQISLSTVKTHVANSYRKLGISSYRQLARTDERLGVRDIKSKPDNR